MSELSNCMAFMTCMIGECKDCPYRNVESDRMFKCQEMLYENITKMMEIHKCDWTTKKGNEY